MFEKPGVVGFDAAQMASDFGDEAIEFLIAAKFGEALELARLGGQALRLLVGDHLQAVLEPAQELIGPGQFVGRFRADPTVAFKLGQHVERAGAAHPRASAAEDELLRLYEELDLADSATAELDVVSGHGDFFVAAERVDLTLHRMDV